MDEPLPLHRLCEVCERTQFDLSTLQQCLGQVCVDSLGKSDESKHTEVLHHHTSRADLEASAVRGCHLCALFLAGLEYQPYNDYTGGSHAEMTTKEAINHCLNHMQGRAPPQPGVNLAFVRNETEDEEAIVVHCDGKYVKIAVASLPHGQCDDDKSATEQPQALFVALPRYGSHDGDNPPEWPHELLAETQISGGIYKAGMPLKVYEERDGWWLATTLWNEDRLWVPAGRHSKLLNPPHHDCICGKGVWERPLLNYSKSTAYIDVDPASEAVIFQIKRWLQECREYDSKCSPPPGSRLPYRVLDVGPPDGSQDPFLSVGRDRAGKYATLSYRWGVGCNLTTTMETFVDRTHGIALALLPGTIRDAVLVARKLGFRYLWVDALCIIQDSPQDWLEQSILMAEIYRNASLNISADCANNASDGFLKPRNPLEIRSCIHFTLFKGESEPKAICPPLPDTNDGVTKGALAKRGWILQERALSRRIVHWTANEVAWECNEMQATERLPGHDHWTKSTIDFSAGATLPGTVIVGHQIKRSDYDGVRLAVQAVFDNETSGALTAKPDTRPDFNAWCDLVQEYSSRQLTKSEDRLPAIASLADAFHRSTGTENAYIVGLWSQDIVRGLIWSSRSREANMPKSHDLPTFSWAYLEEPIEFDYWDYWDIVPETEAKLIEYNLDTPGGPYGPVSKAEMTLHGYHKKFVDLPQEEERDPGTIRWPKGKVVRDYWLPDTVWKSIQNGIIVLCLRTTTHTSKDKETEVEKLVRRMFCLIIRPNGNSGKYYRLGLYTDEEWDGSLDGWDEGAFVLE